MLIDHTNWDTHYDNFNVLKNDLLPHLDHGLHPALIAKAMEQLRTFIPARLWREALIAAHKRRYKLKPLLEALR